MQGCRGALGALQQQRRQAGGGRARAGVWRPGAPAYWREVGNDWHLQWAGLLQQRAKVILSLSLLSVSVFYFLSLFFWI